LRVTLPGESFARFEKLVKPPAIDKKAAFKGSLFYWRKRGTKRIDLPQLPSESFHTAG
jgi:hypothetical protein